MPGDAELLISFYKQLPQNSIVGMAVPLIHVNDQSKSELALEKFSISAELISDSETSKPGNALDYDAIKRGVRESRILLVRGQKVMIDADLAALYGVPTKRLNEQVKRNSERFPQDFMFQLTVTEKTEVVANCDHLAKLKFSKVLPFAFTEHGAIQAANVLASPQAVQMGVYIVRAFVRLRELIVTHTELAIRLDELEQTIEALSLRHDTFAHNTRVQLQQVFEAIRELMGPPNAPRKRPIGFVAPEEKPAKL